MDIQIRKATFSDLEAILSLSQALFTYERAFGMTFNMDWTYSETGRAHFTSRIRMPNSYILLAIDNGTAVGYVSFVLLAFPHRSVNPIAELENLFVLEKYRGKGIGTKLAHQGMEIARSHGARRFRVEALAQNAVARKLYAKLGFSDFEVILEQDA